MRVFVTTVIGAKDVEENERNKKKLKLTQKIYDDCYELVKENVEMQIRITNLPPRAETQ